MIQLLNINYETNQTNTKITNNFFFIKMLENSLRILITRVLISVTLFCILINFLMYFLRVYYYLFVKIYNRNRKVQE